METIIEYAASAAFIGVIATATMDLAGLALQKFAGLPLPNYRAVGRWIGHMGRGRFRHTSIAAAAPVRGEALIGWLAHYAIGIGFASLLVVIGGQAWLHQPGAGLPLAVGLGSLAAPMLLMQPAMGAGIASRRTPDPAAARRRSLINHLLFAIGLHVAGQLAALLLAR